MQKKICFFVGIFKVNDEIRKSGSVSTRGGRSAYEFRYAIFRYVAKQGKWEAPAIYWRYQTVS
jgi:hypothetical protein